MMPFALRPIITTIDLGFVFVRSFSVSFSVSSLCRTTLQPDATRDDQLRCAEPACEKDDIGQAGGDWWCALGIAVCEQYPKRTDRDDVRSCCWAP
jgi:hypothetical protein